MDNMRIWDQHKRPPKSALKQIVGGRMKGMTDISPQWRLQAITETFGPCGTGWWYKIKKTKTHNVGDEIAVEVVIALYYRIGDEISVPVVGVGGSMLRVEERNGLRCNDEAFKMATTDALSVCCKQLGIGSDIYMGMYDGSKYRDDAPAPAAKPAPKKQAPAPIDMELRKAKQALVMHIEQDREGMYSTPTNDFVKSAVQSTFGKSTLSTLAEVQTLRADYDGGKIDKETGSLL